MTRDWSTDDPAFGPPWLDVDEWRDTPIRHRYVHGGFGGTNTRFEMRFPELSRWQGRLLQWIGGGAGGAEAAGDTALLVAASIGAYQVSSNHGWRTGTDPLPGDQSILGYRANAQTARYSAKLAEQTYGRPPQFRYTTGGSGGGNRSIIALEQTSGIWHGAACGLMIVEDLCWAMWSLGAWAAPILREAVPSILDALEPGGTGDPFAALSPTQRDALAALYRLGFPRGAEILLSSAGLFTAGWYYVPLADPTYFTDFWSKPGYAGHDGDVRRVRGTAVVGEVLKLGDLESRDDIPPEIARPVFGTTSPDAIAALRVRTSLPLSDLVGAHVCVARGPRAGSELLITAAAGEFVFPQTWAAFSPTPTVEAGDEITIDNGAWLAFQHYHRYREQRRGIALQTVAGLPYTGVHEGKLILFQSAQDHMAGMPSGHLYAQKVSARDRFRLWWIDNADHGSAPNPPHRSRFVDFWGFFSQGLRDLVAWVEDGVEPPGDSGYRIDGDGILHLEQDAAKRGGIQPAVSLTANGGPRADIRPGEPVELEVAAATPAGTGQITGVDWDFDGTGDWTSVAPVVPNESVSLQVKHAYASPGTYYPGVRVRAHRDGKDGDPAASILNIARARVVVGP